eukprot:11193051-Heterocapsa_arctica.AAC.1
MGQFTTPKTRQHHGERTGPDYSGTGYATAISWHWDRVVSFINAYLAANSYDVQTQFGWTQL